MQIKAMLTKKNMEANLTASENKLKKTCWRSWIHDFLSQERIRAMLKKKNMGANLAVMKTY